MSKEFAAVTIGIPCFNESLTVAQVIEDYRRSFPEARILVIDNASTDQTFAFAKEAGADVVCERRKGKGNAVRRLFAESTTEWLLMCDGDGTYPAKEAMKLLESCKREQADMGVGSRTSRDPQAFKQAHTFANRFLSGLLEQVFGDPCGDLFSGLRCFSKRYYKSVPLESSGFEIETELSLQALDKGFRQCFVKVEYLTRPAGSVSKLNTFTDGARVLKSILVIIKDFKPMLFFGLVATLLAAAALFAGFWPLLDYLRHQYVYRVPLAILAAGLGMLSAVCMACGLLLDTMARHWRREFLLRLRNLESQ